MELLPKKRSSSTNPSSTNPSSTNPSSTNPSSTITSSQNLDEFEILSAFIIDHQRDHITDLDLRSAASLNSSIFHKVNVERNESKVLSSLQWEPFTAESLKSFIRKVWSLKNERMLPDDTAISALSLLLPDVASKWWEDTRQFVPSWNLAVALILKVLNNERTLEDAWREFEHSNHQYDRNLIPFLNEQRILLAEIRQSNIMLTEQMEIDLIYSKLNSTIKKKIDRKKMTSFDELIKLAQSHGLMECDPKLNEDSNERCAHCQQFGHNDTVCCDRKHEVDRDAQIVRYQLSIIPHVALKVNGIPDHVHLASDSKLNIITDSLYGKLLQRGCVFESSKQIVSNAKSSKKNLLQMAVVIVECNQRLVVTPIVKLHNTRGIKNSFGLRFIESCDLLHLKSGNNKLENRCE